MPEFAWHQKKEGVGGQSFPKDLPITNGATFTRRDNKGYS